VPNFPRLRALALFGRRLPRRVEPPVIPASENQHTSGHDKPRDARFHRQQEFIEVIQVRA
jgi:hypothetical protein